MFIVAVKTLFIIYKKMKILDYDFEVPWTLGHTFNNVPGIYIIYSGQSWLDVGETDKLGQRINGENHERKPQWMRIASGNTINIAFLRVNSLQDRLFIESRLRQILNPACGDR
jgi:hypothetical protein